MTPATREMHRSLTAIYLELPKEIADDVNAKVKARVEELQGALAALYADCADYIRINNLYRADGKSAIWNQVMQQAATALNQQSAEPK